MRLDHVSYVTSHDQLADTVQRLGARLGSTFVDGGVHPRFGTRNFTMPLQNGQYIEVVCPLDHPATEQATNAAEQRNEKEVDDLSLAYGKGATGRGMATGGSKAIKDLEKEQKTRQTRMIRDGLDAALLDIATFYRDVMMVQAGANDALINKELETEIRTLAEKTKPQSTIKKINAIMDARTNLSHNAAPLLTVEALMCVLAR